jgi:hypothetical protein
VSLAPEPDPNLERAIVHKTLSLSFLL